MMGAIGTGTIRDGSLTMSLGTSGTLYGYSDKPVIDPDGNLAAFCSSSGAWLPLLCTMNCTVATEIMRDLFKIDVKELENLASESPVGSQGVITLPFFNGERIPNLPNGRGCLVGMTSTNVSQANIIRSAMESSILGLRLGLDSFVKLGFKPKEIRLIGGGSRNREWRQMAADIFALPVVVPSVDDAAAFGAVLQALYVLNNKSDLSSVIDTHVVINENEKHLPKEKNVDKYNVVYSEYCKYIEQLKELFE
jgi:xylulokinase